MSVLITTLRGLTGKRLGILFAISVVATATLVGSGYWFHDHIPDQVFWRMGLAFLNALEIVYCVTAALAFVSAVILAALSFVRRGKAVARGKLARALLLSVSLSIGLLLAEAATAFWLRFAHPGPLIPPRACTGRRCGPV